MTDFLRNMPDEAAALHKRAKEILLTGLSLEEATTELAKEGIAVFYAEMVIDNLLNDMRNRRDFFKMLIMAAFTVTGALALNYFSYDWAARSGAGFMLVFWGLVVAGIIMFIQAIGIYRKLPKY